MPPHRWGTLHFHKVDILHFFGGGADSRIPRNHDLVGGGGGTVRKVGEGDRQVGYGSVIKDNYHILI